MMPHIYLSFISLREWKSVIFRLLINCFYLIQNSRQAPPAVMQTSFAYDGERLLFKQTYLKRCSTFGGNNSTTSSFFVFRWLSIFWITNRCLLDTSLCLTLRAAFSLQIGFPANLSMQYRYNLNCTTALLTGFNVDVKNSFKSLRPGHRLVFLCPCFSCPLDDHYSITVWRCRHIKDWGASHVWTPTQRMWQPIVNTGSVSLSILT